MRIDSDLIRNHPAQAAWAEYVREARRKEIHQEIVALFERLRTGR